MLSSPERTAFGLENLPIEEVWGIGPRNAAKLIKIGVNIAKDFAAINNYEYIDKRFTITGLRTWYELNGKSVLSMEYMPPDKKGICTGRSLARRPTTMKSLRMRYAPSSKIQRLNFVRKARFVVKCRYFFKHRNLKLYIKSKALLITWILLSQPTLHKS